MSLKVKCARCQRSLNEYGANLYGPPEYLTKAHERELKQMGYECLMTRKIHICKDCWIRMLKWIFKRK